MKISIFFFKNFFSFNTRTFFTLGGRGSVFFLFIKPFFDPFPRRNLETIRKKSDHLGIEHDLIKVYKMTLIDIFKGVHKYRRNK